MSFIWMISRAKSNTKPHSTTNEIVMETLVKEFGINFFLTDERWSRSKFPFVFLTALDLDGQRPSAALLTDRKCKSVYNLNPMANNLSSLIFHLFNI